MKRRYWPRTIVGAAGCLSALLVAAAMFPDRIALALESPYGKTEHGGTDVNHDGTTGALREPNQPVAGYNIDPAKFPAGACIHCHDEHASLNGVEHTPAASLVYQSQENLFCGSCHDKPNTNTFDLPWYVGWAGAQRGTTYAMSKHGSSSAGAQWVVGSSYNGIANVLNNDLITPAPAPGMTKVHDKASCMNCHDPHGANPGAAATALMTPAEQTAGVITGMLVRTLGSQTGTAPTEANALCNYCHNNTQLFPPGSDHSVASPSYSYKGSAGTSTTYSGYSATLHRTSTHAYNLFPGTATYPARTGEKGQCGNCHDPHGGAPGGNINGAAGGSAPSNRSLVAPMIDPNTPASRNTLCFTCHNNINGSGSQPLKSQALYQTVMHGSSTSAVWGRTTDVYDNSATSYDQATAAWAPRSSGDYGLCLNCHNPHTKTVGAATVNGSTTAPNQLVDAYHNGDSTTVTRYSRDNSKLCYDCHNEARLTTDGGKTAFPLHSLHMKGDVGALCNDCHNPHAYSASQVAGSPPAGARNISFSATTVRASTQSATINGAATKGPLWFYNTTVNGASRQYGCQLSCHGHDHQPETYTPGLAPNVKAELVVEASPHPTRGVDTVRLTLQSASSGAAPGQVEYAMDTMRAGAAVTRIATQRAAAAGARRGRAPETATTFDLKATGWAPRSSHSVYVRAVGGGRGAPVWSGAMIGVTSAHGDEAAITYYLDEDCKQPAPTPGGTPVLPARGTVYVRVSAPHVAGYRLRIDAPGDDNSLAKSALKAISDTEAVVPWVIEDGADTNGRARVSLIDTGGRSVAPGSGEYVFIGEALRTSVFFEWKSTPDVLDADGRSTARVTVRLTDANGGGLPMRSVDFRRLAGGGTLTPRSPATDSTGAVEAIYMAGVTAETADVQVLDRASNTSAHAYVRLRLTGSTTITLSGGGRRILPGGAGPNAVAVNAYPQRIPADGLSTARLVATVTDARGMPKAGVALRFEVAGRNGSVITTRPVTDASGRAEAVYMAGRTPGEITVVVTDASTGSVGTAVLTQTGNGPAKVVVHATPETMPADGRSMARITVQVTDLVGRPVVGAAVQLHTNSGYGIVAAADPTTNALGEVSAMFRAGPTPGVDTVVATVVSALPGETGSASPAATGRAVSRSASTGSGIAMSRSVQDAQSRAPMGADAPTGGRERTSGGSGGVQIPPAIFRLLNNLSVSYGHWDDYLTLEGPNVAKQSPHLKADSWNVRFKQPMGLGIGGLTAQISADTNESEQYGLLSRYSTRGVIVRGSGRYYDLLGNFTQGSTKSTDLRTGLDMTSDSNGSLLGVTLRVPHMPVLNATHYKATYTNGFGDSKYSLGFDRTDLTLFKQLGPLGIRLTSTDSAQDQGSLGAASHTAFRYTNAAFTLTKDVGRNLNVDFTINRTGTRADSSQQDRTTNQTTSNVQLRFTPSANLVVTGTHDSNSVGDSSYAGGSFRTAMQSLNASYQPARYLALNAGMEWDNSVTPTGNARFNTRTLGGNLLITRKALLTFGVTHTEEPALLSIQSLRTDSRSIQLLSPRLLPGTDLILGWMSLKSGSAVGLDDISTVSARVESLVALNLRATAGMATSRMSSSTEGQASSIHSDTQDLALTWTPNARTQVGYTLSRLSQSGLDASSTSTTGLFRVQTVLRRRAFLIVESADNLLDSAVNVPGSIPLSLRGRRLSFRLNYLLDPGSSAYIEYEKTRDDSSGYTTRSFRVGHSLLF